MHRMLLRQLNRFFGPADAVPAHLRNFINSIDEAYQQYDADHNHLQNALDQASKDLVERNRLVAQRNKELEGIKQAAVDCIIIADFEGKIIDANPAGQAALGRSIHELRGHIIYETIISGPHQEGLAQLIGRHLSGHETGVSRIETRCTRPASGEFAVEMAITVVRGDGPSQIVVCFRDISRGKNGSAGAAPQQQQQAPILDNYAEVFARISGQLAEPIQEWVHNLQMLEDTPLNGKQRQYAEGLHDASDKVLGLLSKLVEQSSGGGGGGGGGEDSQIEIGSTEFDLGRTIEAMVEELAPEAARKGLEFAYRVNPDVPVAVVGDPQRYRQVLMNLVNNAIKFTDHGEVSVAVTASEQTDSTVVVRCAVKDTGRGIPEEQLERLYQTMSEGQSSRGLAVCRQLVVAMGGSIGMESQPGEGSTFWFTARLGKQHMSSSQDDDDGPMLRSTDGLHVLCVDDNATNCSVMKEQLGGWRMTAQTALSGSEALKLLLDAVVANKPFDVAVIDYEMPGMDGIELGRTIRAIPSFRKIPMILLRPSTAMVNDMMLKDGGFSVCLAKPVRPTQLREAIEQSMSGGAVAATGNLEGSGYMQEEEQPRYREEQPAPPGPMKLEAVIEKCMGDLSYLERILYKFQDQSNETISRITERLNMRDKNGAIELVLALKGAAEYLGADDLRDHALHLAEIVKLGVFNEAHKAMGPLKEEVSRCIEYIPEMLHQAASRRAA